MKLQKSLLASSVAAAMLAGAGQALAWVPVWSGGVLTNGTVAIPAAKQIWHGGATASTASVQAAVCNAICDPDSPTHVFEDDRSAGKPDFWFIACKGKDGVGTEPTALPASLAGAEILWSKRDEGGSGVGVGPVAIPFPIGFMKPATGAGTNFDPALEVGGKAPVVKACGTIAGATYRKSTGFAVPATTTEADALADAVIRPPTIGTSDIEPDKFTPSFPFNVPVSDLNLDGIRGGAGDVLGSFTSGLLTIAGLGQLTFNTPVNLRMYLDLQAAQFPTLHPLHSKCNPSGADYGMTPAGAVPSGGTVPPTWTDGSGVTGMPVAGGLLDARTNANSEDCMPSLMASEIRSIMKKDNTIESSKDFQAETTYGGGAFAELVATTRGAATDNTIAICRRVNGSGTQAQANAMIIGYPCDPNLDGSIDSLLPEAEGGFAAALENESSGDVEKCLNDLNDGTNTSTKNSLLRKRWAIGVQSLEKNAPSTTTHLYPNAYRFIKIDGFAPSLVNVHAGDYYDVGRQTLQYKTGALTETVDAFTALAPFLSDPAALAGLNKVHAFCTKQDAGGLVATKCAGWLAAPKADDLATLYSEAPTSELDFTAPVAWFHRVSSTDTPNTCALPSVFKKTGGTGTDITVGPATGQSGDANGDLDQNFYTP